MELTEACPPTGWGVLGAGLSRGCTLSPVDPGGGGSLLLGAHSTVVTVGLSALVWQEVAFALWGLKNSSFGFRHKRQLALGSSPLSSFCFSLLTSWDLSLVSCSTWGQSWLVVLSWTETEASPLSCVCSDSVLPRGATGPLFHFITTGSTAGRWNGVEVGQARPDSQRLPCLSWEPCFVISKVGSVGIRWEDLMGRGKALVQGLPHSRCSTSSNFCSN